MTDKKFKELRDKTPRKNPDLARAAKIANPKGGSFSKSNGTLTGNFKPLGIPPENMEPIVWKTEDVYVKTK